MHEGFCRLIKGVPGSISLKLRRAGFLGNISGYLWLVCLSSAFNNSTVPQFNVKAFHRDTPFQKTLDNVSHISREYRSGLVLWNLSIRELKQTAIAFYSYYLPFDIRRSFLPWRGVSTQPGAKWAQRMQANVAPGQAKQSLSPRVIDPERMRKESRGLCPGFETIWKWNESV